MRYLSAKLVGSMIEWCSIGLKINTDQELKKGMRIKMIIRIKTWKILKIILNTLILTILTCLLLKFLMKNK